MSDVLNVLGAGIVQRFKVDIEGAALRNAVTGGISNDRQKHGAVPPYVDYTMEAVDFMRTYSSRIEIILVTFGIYTGEKQDPKPGYVIFNLLTNVYDDVSDLTVPGFKLVSFERQTVAVVRDPDDQGFMTPVEYMARIG